MKTSLTLRALPALMAIAFSGSAAAAGFQLLEQNASGLGNAYAGSAAITENASTIFYNPAGMTQLPGTSVSAGVSVIRPSFTFTNSGSTNPTAMNGGAATGGNGGDAAGNWAPVPNAYIAHQVSDRLHVGLGLGAPFGLATEYDDTWVGRYHSIKFDIKTYNINPSIAYKLNDSVSVGLGANWQRVEAEYKKSAALAPGVASIITNNLSGDAWGWNAGILIQATPSTKLGASYRSSMRYSADGTQKSANGAVNTWAKADVELPDSFILSATHELNDSWTLLGDVSWTGWSKLPKLEIVSGLATDSLALKFRDTVRYAVGATYKIDDAWKLKIGAAYDQSPVYLTENRPASLPDNNRTWLSIGLQYKPSKAATVDVGYAYLMVPTTPIANNENIPRRGLLSGTYNSSGQILGVQYSHTF